MRAGAVAAIAVSIAAVVGLLGGAIWAQVGSRQATPGASSAAPSSYTDTPAPGASTETGSPSESASLDSPPESSPSSTPASTSTDPTSAITTPTGTIPSAPATTSTSADGWRLGSWKILNLSGKLAVETTARNTTSGTRSADLVVYVYVDGQPVATTTAHVSDVAAGATVPVSFTGTDAWKAGSKVLLLVAP